MKVKENPHLRMSSLGFVLFWVFFSCLIQTPDAEAALKQKKRKAFIDLLWEGFIMFNCSNPADCSHVTADSGSVFFFLFSDETNKRWSHASTD